MMRIYIGEEQAGNENEPNDLCKVTAQTWDELLQLDASLEYDDTSWNDY